MRSFPALRRFWRRFRRPGLRKAETLRVVATIRSRGRGGRGLCDGCDRRDATGGRRDATDGGRGATGSGRDEPTVGGGATGSRRATGHSRHQRDVADLGGGGQLDGDHLAQVEVHVTQVEVRSSLPLITVLLNRYRRIDPTTTPEINQGTAS